MAKLVSDTKALVGNENGEWEFRYTKRNDDGSYSIGPGDYIAEPKQHVQTLKIKTAFGVKRYKFFIAHIESPIPVTIGTNGHKQQNRIISISDRPIIEGKDSPMALRSFRRAKIVEGLGKASRELPGNNTDKMKMLGMVGLAILGLILYYTGVVEQLIGWLTGAQ